MQSTIVLEVILSWHSYPKTAKLMPSARRPWRNGSVLRGFLHSAAPAGYRFTPRVVFRCRADYILNVSLLLKERETDALSIGGDG